MAVGLGVSTLLGVPDWLLHNNVISPEGWFLGAYTNAITFGMFGVLMYRRYVTAIARWNRSTPPGQRLAAREAELEDHSPAPARSSECAKLSAMNASA